MSQSLESTKYEEVSRGEESGRDFASIFNEYQRPIFNYLFRMTQKSDLAEDLEQETFIRVHKGLSSFRGESRLSTWICRIATNVGFDDFRSKGSRQEKATVSIDETEADRVWIPDEDLSPPEQVAVQSEMSACVQRFIHIQVIK